MTPQTASVLNVDDANGRIALQYRPMSGNTTGRVEISIETHAAGEKKDWKVDAIDWLER